MHKFVSVKYFYSWNLLHRQWEFGQSGSRRCQYPSLNLFVNHHCFLIVAVYFKLYNSYNFVEILQFIEDGGINFAWQSPSKKIGLGVEEFTWWKNWALFCFLIGNLIVLLNICTWNPSQSTLQKAKILSTWMWNSHQTNLYWDQGWREASLLSALDGHLCG